jgi:Cytochrome P460
MRRRTWTLLRRLLLGALLAAACLSCGDNQDDAGARELLARVRADGYRDWDRAPGYEARRRTNAPHGNDVDIYVNDIVAEVLALGEHDGSWPEGSIIVKDGWDGSHLELIALMEKRPNGWFWAEYDDDGDPDYSGKPDVCLDCHNSGSDYVRAFILP